MGYNGMGCGLVKTGMGWGEWVGWVGMGWGGM